MSLKLAMNSFTLVELRDLNEQECSVMLRLVKGKKQGEESKAISVIQVRDGCDLDDEFSKEGGEK